MLLVLHALLSLNVCMIRVSFKVIIYLLIVLSRLARRDVYSKMYEYIITVLCN